MQEGNKGGDITFMPGKGSPADGLRAKGVDGSVVFKMVDGKEFMRVDPDGEVYVWGTKVCDDRKIYENFREWLSHARLRLIPVQSGAGQTAEISANPE